MSPTQTNPPLPIPENQGDKPSSRPGSGIDYEKFLDCVHCGLCTSACPTYLETGDENDSPRGRIYLMRAIVDGRLELNETVQRHLDLCLDCRSCETACPSGVQYGRLIEPFRVEMQQKTAQTGRKQGPDWFHRWILYGLFPYPNRLRWALAPMRMLQKLRLDRAIDTLGFARLLPEKLRRMHDLLPRLQPPAKPLPEVLPPRGKKRARVGLFTGCVGEALFSQTNRATARVLQANGCEVVVPRHQTCCAAIHYHSGAGEPALEFARENVSAFDLENLDAVLVNVAGCGSMMKDYDQIAAELAPNNTDQHKQLAQFAGKVRDVSEFLSELGPTPPTGEIPLRATYHDACHLAHGQGVRDEPRELLAMIPGLELVPLAESDICCGAAGSYNLTEGEMADRLAERKRKNILATGARAVITGNAGCSLQLQSTFRKAGDDLWVVHPMDLLDWSYRGLSPPI